MTKYHLIAICNLVNLGWFIRLEYFMWHFERTWFIISLIAILISLIWIVVNKIKLQHIQIQLGFIKFGMWRVPNNIKRTAQSNFYSYIINLKGLQNQTFIHIFYCIIYWYNFIRRVTCTIILQLLVQQRFCVYLYTINYL